MKTKILNEAGFTLMELMTVVTIVGIIAAIGYPQYQGIQARSRRSEVKVTLASYLSYENTFRAANGSYSACLREIIGDDTIWFSQAPRYYATVIGSNAYASTNCGDGSLGCNATAYTTSEDNGISVKSVSGTCDITSTGQDSNTGFPNPGGPSPRIVTAAEIHQNVVDGGNSPCNQMTANTVGICSYGAIEGDPVDGWMIDQTGTLTWRQSGIKGEKGPT